MTTRSNQVLFLASAKIHVPMESSFYIGIAELIAKVVLQLNSAYVQ